MFVHEREHCIHDIDRHLHEFLLILCQVHIIRIYDTHTHQPCENVFLTFYRRMCQMDKVGKNLVAELVHRQAI